jgi:hypothetical protein
MAEPAPYLSGRTRADADAKSPRSLWGSDAAALVDAVEGDSNSTMRTGSAT